MSLKPKPVDFDATWQTLKNTIIGVITLAHVPRPVWNDRFSDVYSICVASPEPLADRLYLETKKFLIEHVTQLQIRIRQDGREHLIKNYYQYWSQYSTGSQYLHSLYLYLNQQHIRSQKMSDAELIYGGDEHPAHPGNEIEILPVQMEIGELALQVWQMKMIFPLGDDLINLILDAIEKDRSATEPSAVSIDALKGTILSFVDTQAYKKKNALFYYVEVFEVPFLDASGEHFKRDAARLLESKNVSLYMEKCKAKIEEEVYRGRRFLHSSTIPKLTQRCEKHMVEEHIDFLYSDVQAMVKEERISDLSNMYDLLRTVQNGLSLLIDTVYDHIKQQGLSAVHNLQGETNHIQFVDNILVVYKKYRALIEDVFKGDQVFIGTLDKACSAIINFRGRDGKLLCKSAELLAKYCDFLLKKSSKGISETEVDEKLTESIIIFKYIDDKDVFQKFYSRALAKRLIHQQTQSMDAEEGMINRLKQACGFEFTSKLHRMFTDMSVSADLNGKFQSYMTANSIDLGVHFNIYVLQAGAWPLNHGAPTPSFSLPQQLERSVQLFETFYRERFNGRKLTWMHHLCQAELKLGYLKKTYVITIQTYQMAILLLFENTDIISCKEIIDSLQLTCDVFKRHVLSLTESKLLIMDTDELCEQSNFKLNTEFSNRRTKFRITATLQKETPTEVEQTMTSIEEDRKLYLQATIVRIMKSRKVLKHNLLIQEVFEQSRRSFTPPVPLVKKCIEALLDKQYIERMPNSNEEYRYIA